MLGFSHRTHRCLPVVLLATACGPKLSDPTIDEGSTGSPASTGATDDMATTAGPDDTTAGVDAACEAAGVTTSRQTFETARDAAGGQYWYTTQRTAARVSVQSVS